MIINCEKCGAKFNLDENLLNKNGSKVRCSVCKHIFIVKPPEPEEESAGSFLEEMVDLDSPPVFEDTNKLDINDDKADEDYEKAFEDALNEDIKHEVIPTEEEESEEPEAEPEAPKIKNKRPLILALIIAVFIILVGGLSAYLFAPGLLPGNNSESKTSENENTPDTGNRRLDILDLEGSFFSTDKIGQLYIIKGKILNNYPQNRSYILIKATIEDDKRNPIDRKRTYAGNIFTEDELKGITIEEIERKLKIKSGGNNSNIDVEPQETVPFMIIFYNLPDSISTYAVETISSSPGK